VQRFTSGRIDFDARMVIPSKLMIIVSQETFMQGLKMYSEANVGREHTKPRGLTASMTLPFDRQSTSTRAPKSTLATTKKQNKLGALRKKLVGEKSDFYGRETLGGWCVAQALKLM